ncbi:MAG: MerR family transcriptional regulator [Parvularculaceae bacterium]
MAIAKSAEAFRTISEAAGELDVPQHVLRHWEDAFGQIRPMRRAGGRRYYRPVDIDILRGVRSLLYDQRFTTKGVQKIFRDHGVKYVAEIGRLAAADQPIELRPMVNEEDDDRDDRSDHGAEIELTQAAAVAAPAGGLSDETQSSLRAMLLRLENAQTALDDAVIALEAVTHDSD